MKFHEIAEIRLKLRRKAWVTEHYLMYKPNGMLVEGTPTATKPEDDLTFPAVTWFHSVMADDWYVWKDERSDDD